MSSRENIIERNGWVLFQFEFSTMVNHCHGNMKSGFLLVLERFHTKDVEVKEDWIMSIGKSKV